MIETGDITLVKNYVLSQSEIIKSPDISLTNGGRRKPPVSLRVVVEVPGVTLVTHFWHPGGLHRPEVDLLPVHRAEISATIHNLNEILMSSHYSPP